MNEQEREAVEAEIKARFGEWAELMPTTVEDEFGVLVDRWWVIRVVGEGVTPREALDAAIAASPHLQLQ